MAGSPTGPNSDLGKYLALAQVGFEMVVPIALGMIVDNYLGWAPWGVLVGAVLGLAGGLTHMVVLLRRFDDTDPSRPGRDKS